jgi:hypothetical protein
MVKVAADLTAVRRERTAMTNSPCGWACPGDSLQVTSARSGFRSQAKSAAFALVVYGDSGPQGHRGFDPFGAKASLHSG